MTEQVYVPSDVHLGGQRTSSSQLRTATTCWQEFFLSYIAPHPKIDNSAGLRSRVTEGPLMTGSAVHRGLHGYFLSGWKDGGDTGQRSVEKSLTIANEYLESVSHLAVSVEKWNESVQHTQRCLEKFDDYLVNGRIGQLTVVGDANGEPMLERELLIPLVGGRFIYVDKIDGLFDNRQGYRQVGEYKTSGASGASDARMGLTLSGQGLGHLTGLQELAPKEPLHGVVYITLIKNRGEKNKQDPHIYIDDVILPPENLEYYKQILEQLLEEIVDRSLRWENLCRDGWDPYQAGLNCFPMTGIMNGQCKRYRRMCPFAGYCEAHSYGSNMLQGFVPRTVDGEPFEVEEPTSSEGEIF